MLLRLDNAFSNPGIKGWVPADKPALISKGSSHLLIKRCVAIWRCRCFVFSCENVYQLHCVVHVRSRM